MDAFADIGADVQRLCQAPLSKSTARANGAVVDLTLQDDVVARPPAGKAPLSFSEIVASSAQQDDAIRLARALSSLGRKQGSSHESKQADESKQKDGREEAKVPESRSNAALQVPRAAREERKEEKEEKEHDREEPPDDDADCGLCASHGGKLPHCSICEIHLLVPAAFDCCDHGVGYCVPCAHKWFKASPYPSSSVEIVNGIRSIIVVKPYPCPDCRKSVSSVHDVPLPSRQPLSPIQLAAAKSDDALMQEAEQIIVLSRIGAPPDGAEAEHVENQLIQFKYQELVQSRKEAQDKIAAPAGVDVAGDPFAAAIAASNAEAQAEAAQADQFQLALVASSQLAQNEEGKLDHQLNVDMAQAMVLSDAPPLHAPVLAVSEAANDVHFALAVAESNALAAQAELLRQQEEDEFVRAMQLSNTAPNFHVEDMNPDFAGHLSEAGDVLMEFDGDAAREFDILVAEGEAEFDPAPGAPEVVPPPAPEVVSSCPCVCCNMPLPFPKPAADPAAAHNAQCITKDEHRQPHLHYNLPSILPCGCSRVHKRCLREWWLECVRFGPPLCPCCGTLIASPGINIAIPFPVPPQMSINSIQGVDFVQRAQRQIQRAGPPAQVPIQPVQHAAPAPQAQPQPAPQPRGPLSKDDVLSTERTWKKLPAKLLPQFTRIASIVLNNVTKALAEKRADDAALHISMFARLPGLMLKKSKGGKGKRAQQQLAGNINFVSSFFKEDHEMNDADFSVYSDALLAAHDADASKAAALDAVAAYENREADAAHIAALTEEARELGLRISKAQDFMADGHAGRATKALLKSAPLMPIDDVVEQKLRDLHPTPPPDRVLPERPVDLLGNQRVTVEKKLLLKCLDRIASGSAPDASGWTGDLLKQIAEDDICLDGLMVLVEAICNDELDDHSRGILLQSRLLALVKEEGDPTPRPIAIGGALYKLACVYSINLVRDQLGDFFEPLQFAVCSSGGAERLFHRLQAALEAGGPEVCMLFTDVKNAFNAANRADNLSELYKNEQFSLLFGVNHFGYGHGPSDLVVRHADGSIKRIQSAEGVRQGCALGTMLYCFGVNPKFKAACANLPSVTAGAFADDFLAVADVQGVLTVLKRLLDLNIGLNMEKTAIAWLSDSPIPQELLDGAAALGCKVVAGGRKALGGLFCLPHEFAAHVAFIQRKVDQHDALFDAIMEPRLSRPIAQILLRLCVQPVLTYLARITPPSIAAVPFAAFDTKLLTTGYQKLLATDIELNQHKPPTITNAVLQQLTFPISLGGGGLRRMSVVSFHAYFAASAFYAPELQQFSTNPGVGPYPDASLVRPFEKHLWHAYSTLVGLGVPTKPVLHIADGDKKAFLPADFTVLSLFYEDVVNTKGFKLQRLTTHQAEKIVIENHVASLDLHDQVRFASLSGYGASAYLTVYPDFNRPRSLISSDYFRYVYRLRFGLAPVDGLVLCVCGASLEGPFGKTHGFVCVKFRRCAITNRHNGLVRVIHSATEEAGVQASMEFAPPDQDFELRLRPDGISHFADHSRMTDVQVTDPNCPSVHSAQPVPSVKGCLAVLHSRAAAKVAKYKNLAAAEHCAFSPLLLDTYGRMHPELVRYLRRVQHAAMLNNVSHPVAPSKLFRRLVEDVSMALQRGNAWVLNQAAHHATKRFVGGVVA
jgi:hypothetical protein